MSKEVKRGSSDAKVEVSSAKCKSSNALLCRLTDEFAHSMAMAPAKCLAVEVMEHYHSKISLPETPWQERLYSHEKC